MNGVLQGETVQTSTQSTPREGGHARSLFSASSVRTSVVIYASSAPVFPPLIKQPLSKTSSLFPTKVAHHFHNLRLLLNWLQFQNASLMRLLEAVAFVARLDSRPLSSRLQNFRPSSSEQNALIALLPLKHTLYYVTDNSALSARSAIDWQPPSSTSSSLESKQNRDLATSRSPLPP